MLDILAQSADKMPYDLDWRYILRLAVIGICDIIALFFMVTAVRDRTKNDKDKKGDITMKAMAVAYVVAVVGMAVVESFSRPHLSELTLIAVAAVPAVIGMLCFGLAPAVAIVLMFAFLGYRPLLEILLKKAGIN
jgi:hypothetical protein